MSGDPFQKARAIAANRAASTGTFAQFYKQAGDALGCDVIEALGDYFYQRATYPNQTPRQSRREAWATVRSLHKLSNVGTAATPIRSRSYNYSFGPDF